MVVVVVLVMMVVLGVVSVVLARRGVLPGAPSDAVRFRSDPMHPDTITSRSCRCQVIVGTAWVSWPIGRLAVGDGHLTIHAPGMSFLSAMSPVPVSLDSLTALDVARVQRVRRVGPLLQWGVILELDEGKLGLWGPSVRATLADTRLPTTVQDRRRPFWAWELRNAAPRASP